MQNTVDRQLWLLGDMWGISFVEEDKEREQRYIGAMNGKSVKVFIAGGITALFSTEKEARSHRSPRPRRTLKTPQLLACATTRHNGPQDVGAQLGRDRQGRS